MRKKIDILFGVLTLVILATLFTSVQDEPRLSPAIQENAPKLSSNTGLIHAPCSEVCWAGDKCKQAESFKGSNNYLCICNSCENIDKCNLKSDNPSEFNWNC
ncbi:hypothetical protein HN865_00265 [Candidatus Woesearchaeota archaeon]|jgi:hypothetical protein|nr:hypothetical protein [Candidatus Woesearchaeota archaeon]MBT7237275.1 hypothetical protein [Candidatus Woesearchaeota archaeon]